jgi:hypothetical protein
MKQHSASLRFAVGVLLASAALPLHAQEVQPPADPTADASATPTVNTPPPTAPVQEPAETVPSQTSVPAAPVASEPVVNTRASGNEPADPGASGAAPAERRSAVRQRATRTTAARSTPPQSARAVAPVATAAAAAAAPEPSPEPPSTEVPAEPAPIAAAPVSEAPTAAEPAPTTTTEQGSGASFWPWLLLGALALAGLLLFTRRRRRVAEEDHVVYDEPATAVAPVMHEPLVHHEPQFERGPIVEDAPVFRRDPTLHDEPTVPVHDTPVRASDHVHSRLAPRAAVGAAAGLAGAAAAAAPATENGRPWLDLQMRPVRAGVGEDAARVEFELGVENNGSAPARDVRVSAWLLAGNSPRQSRWKAC